VGTLPYQFHLNLIFNVKEMQVIFLSFCDTPGHSGHKEFTVAHENVNDGSNPLLTFRRCAYQKIIPCTKKKLKMQYCHRESAKIIKVSTQVETKTLNEMLIQMKPRHIRTNLWVN
jgi:hypothetical protein